MPANLRPTWGNAMFLSKWRCEVNEDSDGSFSSGSGCPLERPPWAFSRHWALRTMLSRPDTPDLLGWSPTSTVQPHLWLRNLTARHSLHLYTSGRFQHFTRWSNSPGIYDVCNVCLQFHQQHPTTGHPKLPQLGTRWCLLQQLDSHQVIWTHRLPSRKGHTNAA